MIPQEQAKQVEQLGHAVVHRRRRHEQHLPAPPAPLPPLAPLAARREPRQRAVAVGLGVPESVGFVDDKQTDSRIGG